MTELVTRLMTEQTCYKVDDIRLVTRLMTCNKVDDSTTCYKVDESTDL